MTISQETEEMQDTVEADQYFSGLRTQKHQEKRPSTKSHEAREVHKDRDNKETRQANQQKEITKNKRSRPNHEEANHAAQLLKLK